MARTKLISAALIILLHLQLTATQYDYGYDYEADAQCSESPADNSLACQRYTSCSLCADYVQNCHCDKLCHSYGDCCQDVTPATTAVRRVPTADVMCQQVLVGNTIADISVISTCPLDYDAEMAEKCRDGVTLLVRDAISGLIYKNSDCVQCHGANNFDQVPVNLYCYPSKPTVDSLSVVLHQLLTSQSYSGPDGTKCQFNYTLFDENNKPQYHPCDEDVVSTCPPDAPQDISTKCYDESMNLLYTDMRNGQTDYPAYRNEWCAQCNGVSSEDLDCQPPPLYAGVKPPSRGFDSLVDLNTLSCINRVIDQDLTTVNAVCDDGKFTCQEGEVYKPFQGCQPDPSSDAKPQLSSGEACKQWVFHEEYSLEGEKASIPSMNVSSEDYVEQDGGVHICMLKSPDSLTQYDYSRQVPSAILTVILVSLSLLAIIVHVILYGMFKALRNVPGLIVLCLITSLFAALLLFVISIFIETQDGTSNGLACSILAILQHYLFLASLFWTNVMAFDVARMLSATIKHSNKRKFIWYSLYAWCCPLVITIGGIVAENYGANYSVKIIPGYGAKTCWINTKYGLLVYFLAPVFLILIVNIIMYIISIVAIVKAARQTKMVNPGLKERFFLALKLVVVMGLPWITAALTAFIESPVLNYIFVILNASQGIFIFASYVLTKTVLNLFKKGTDFSRSRKSYSSNRTSTFSLSKRYSANSLSASKSVRGNQASNIEESKSSNSQMPTYDSIEADKQPPKEDNSNNNRVIRGYTTTV